MYNPLINMIYLYNIYLYNINYNFYREEKEIESRYKK